MKRANFEDYVEASLMCIMGKLGIGDREMALAKAKIKQEIEEVGEKVKTESEERIETTTAKGAGKEPRKKSSSAVWFKYHAYAPSLTMSASGKRTDGYNAPNPTRDECLH